MQLIDLPVGARIKDEVTCYRRYPISWVILEHNHPGDPEGTTTIQSEDVLCLKRFDNEEPDNPDEYREEWGNNRYGVSNLRQWLNKGAEDWFIPAHEYDNAPEYSIEPGFLSQFSYNFLNNIKTATKKTGIPNIDGGGSEELKDLIFLLSSDEVGLWTEGEGSIYELFKSAPETRIKRDYQGIARSWWLRTPYYSSSGIARYVDTSGTLSNYYAYYGCYAVAPACCVLNSLTVCEGQDEDGCHRILFGEDGK